VQQGSLQGDVAKKVDQKSIHEKNVLESWSEEQREEFCTKMSARGTYARTRN